MREELEIKGRARPSGPRRGRAGVEEDAGPGVESTVGGLVGEQ